MMDMSNLFNCGDLLGNFSSPCIPLRLGCENIYQTCFSPSLWQNRWFQRQVEGICVHRECFEENTDNSWPPRCASQKQDSRNIVEPISKRIVNKRWRVWNTPMVPGAPSPDFSELRDLESNDLCSPLWPKYWCLLWELTCYIEVSCEQSLEQSWSLLSKIFLSFHLLATRWILSSFALTGEWEISVDVILKMSQFL